MSNLIDRLHNSSIDCIIYFPVCSFLSTKRHKYLIIVLYHRRHYLLYIIRQYIALYYRKSTRSHTHHTVPLITQDSGPSPSSWPLRAPSTRWTCSPSPLSSRIERIGTVGSRLASSVVSISTSATKNRSTCRRRQRAIANAAGENHNSCNP